MEKIKELLNDSKKRYLLILGCIAPFIIAIVVFGILAIKDIKTILNVVTDDPATVVQENKYYYEKMNYQLRDNATDYQLELFEEMKDLCDNSPSDLECAASVVKNFVADFYTWTNKAGQYDVGGLYYLFEDTKNNNYLNARDGVYKYINEYIDKYGSAELLEVDQVEANGESLGDSYSIGETTYDAFKINAKWSYVQGKKFDCSKFVTEQDFVVVLTRGHYEIVEISEVSK